ncbi:MAG: hypothetical protein JSV51_04555 [Candidatus Bathyarchaeota archaeon]|nr:MAG: hypothetical protein JSV51_04555 [Candidatus Bathyarchaeota archaeon]
MTVKGAIYFFVFVFILVGVFGITTWVVLTNVHPPLSFAVIAFLWGITLAILYLAFDKAGWNWWGS